MSSKPRVLICGKLKWAQDDLQDILGTVADVLYFESRNREEFYKDLSPGGRYEGVVAIYRDHSCSDKIGDVDAELVANLPDSIKWLAQNSAGYDMIDVEACKQKGLMVSNCPVAVDDATATTALYLIISTCREFSKAEQNLRSGNWKYGLKQAHDPSALTLGILGLGGIGMKIAEMVHSFQMRVIYYSRHKREDAPDWCEYFSADRLDEMLAQTDVLSISVPLNNNTEGMVGEKMIRGLKKGAIIVNTARGKVIDEDAMIRALEDGHLSSVGLDVYPNEPNVNPRLLEFPKVVLLPHMGTFTQEAERKMERRTLTNLREFIINGKGLDLIPELRTSGNAKM